MLSAFQPLEQPIMLIDRERRGTILARVRPRAVGTQMLRDDVHPIADPQHGTAKREHLAADIRSAGFVEAPRGARQDYPARLHRPDLLRGEVVWMNLAIDARFTHPSGNELSVLRAKIEDQD